MSKQNEPNLSDSYANATNKIGKTISSKAKKKVAKKTAKAVNKATDPIKKILKKLFIKIFSSPFGVIIIFALIVAMVVASLGNILMMGLTKLESDIAKYDLEEVLGDDYEMTLDSPYWGYSTENLDPTKWNELTADDQYKFIANYIMSQTSKSYNNTKQKFYDDLDNEENDSRYIKEDSIDLEKVKDGDIFNTFDTAKTAQIFEMNAPSIDDLKLSVVKIVSMYTTAHANVIVTKPKKSAAATVLRELKDAFNANNLSKKEALYKYISGKDNLKYTDTKHTLMREKVEYFYVCSCVGHNQYMHSKLDVGKKCPKCKKEIKERIKRTPYEIHYTVRNYWFESDMQQQDISTLYDYIADNVIKNNDGKFEVGEYIANTEEYKENKKNGTWEAIKKVKYKQLIQLYSFRVWYKPDSGSIVGWLAGKFNKDWTDCDAYVDSPEKTCHEDYFGRGDNRHDENDVIPENKKGLDLSYDGDHPFHEVAYTWDGQAKSAYLVRTESETEDPYEYISNTNIDKYSVVSSNSNEKQIKTFGDKYRETIESIKKILDKNDDEENVTASGGISFDKEDIKKALQDYFKKFPDYCPFKKDDVLDAYIDYSLKNNVDPYLGVLLLDIKTNGYTDSKFIEKNNYSFINYGTNSNWNEGIKEYVNLLKRECIDKNKTEILDFLNVLIPNDSNKNTYESKIKKEYKELTKYDYAGNVIGNVKGALTPQTPITEALAWQILNDANDGNKFPAEWQTLQCTAFVSGRIYETTGLRLGLSDGSSAASNLAGSYGTYTMDKKARAGAVLSIENGGINGHVLFVESVDSDGSLVISEGNYRGAPFGIRITKYKSIDDFLNKEGYAWRGQCYKAN